MPIPFVDKDKSISKPKTNCKKVGQLVGLGAMVFFSRIIDNKDIRQLIAGKVAQEAEKACKSFR